MARLSRLGLAVLSATFVLSCLLPIAQAQTMSLEPAEAAPGVAIPIVLQGYDTHFGPDSTVFLDPELSMVWYTDISAVEIRGIVQVSELAAVPQAITVVSPLEGGEEEMATAYLFIDPALSGTLDLTITSPMAAETVPGGVTEVSGITGPGAYVFARYLVDGDQVYYSHAISDEEGSFTIKLSAPGTETGGGGRAARGARATMMPSTHSISVTSTSSPSVQTLQPHVLPVNCPPATGTMPPATYSPVAVVMVTPGVFQCPTGTSMVQEGHYVYSPCCPPLPTPPVIMYLGEKMMLRIDGLPPPGVCAAIPWEPCSGFYPYWMWPPPSSQQAPIENGAVMIYGSTLTTTLHAIRWANTGIALFCANYTADCGSGECVEGEFSVPCREYAIRKVELKRTEGDNETKLEANNPGSHGGGWWWYPGKYKVDGQVHDEIDIKVTLQNPLGLDLTGEMVYVKAVDADDPTLPAEDPETHQQEGDDETLKEDNNGPGVTFVADECDPPLGNPAGFSLEGAAQAFETTLKLKTEGARGYQPGDNFRIVATCERKAVLDRVWGWYISNPPNPNPKDTFAWVYPPPAGGPFIKILDDNTPARFKSSPLLSIWRYLHVERDKMAAPTGAEWNGHLDPFEDVRPLATSPQYDYVSLTHLEQEMNRAFVKVVKVEEPSTPQEPRLNKPDYITIIPWDDEIRLHDEGGDPEDAPDEIMLKADRQVVTSHELWAAYVCTCYEIFERGSAPRQHANQNGEDHDGDPEEPIPNDPDRRDLLSAVSDGQSGFGGLPPHSRFPEWQGVTWIAWETARDICERHGYHGNQLNQDMEYVVTHEIGHYFGINESSGGIYSQKAENLWPLAKKPDGDWNEDADIKDRFRSAPVYTPSHLVKIRKTWYPGKSPGSHD